MPWFDEKDDCLTRNHRVTPRAARDEIQGLMGDALKIRLSAPTTKIREQLLSLGGG